MYWIAAWAGCSRTLMFNPEFRAPLIRFFLAVPFDALFWFTDNLYVIPYVRLIHLVGSIEHGLKLIRMLQHSPAISYNAARLIMLLLVIAVSSRACTARPQDRRRRDLEAGDP